MYSGTDRRPWMLFVDGENFTARGQEFTKSSPIRLTESEAYRPDTFLWLPKRSPLVPFNLPLSYIAGIGLRAYYYTSLCGSHDTIEDVKTSLRRLHFTPRVFKKMRKDQKAKGVDIELTKDMLSHAFLNNYAVACLVSGDGDYVPLVEEVKRLGKIVVCISFENGLSPDLKLACDEYFDIAEEFVTYWHGATQQGTFI